MAYTKEMYEESADYIKKKLTAKPEIGLILGSGLGFLADEVKDRIIIPYEEIPHFKKSTAASHAGRLVFGKLEGKWVIIMQGRFHYYEGYNHIDTAFPVRVMKLLGISCLIVTNASGGINKSYSIGDIMLITDHIKFFDESPLRGENPEYFGERFPDVTYAYTPSLRDIAKKAAKVCKAPLQEGVYAYMPGPQFETPAEIRALRILGADAVGMSTVSEVITAVHCGLKVLGFSCICNMAAGVDGIQLNGDDVCIAADKAKVYFSALIRECVKNI